MTRSARSGQAGFTFIEVLLAMTLMLIIFAATLAVFTTMERGSSRNQKLNENQQQARVATDTLAKRLRNASENMADLVFTDVPGRVAKALLDLSRRFGERDGDGIRVHHDLTQEELAQLVGASRETVNKALADFSARGWIRVEARSVVLLDLDRLVRRAR